MSQSVAGVVDGRTVFLDTLLRIVQMPPEIPGVTMSVDRDDNAGFLAAQILGVADAALARRLDVQRSAASEMVLADDRSIQG